MVGFAMSFKVVALTINTTIAPSQEQCVWLSLFAVSV